MEFVAVGGYGEVGRNMTAIKVGDEVVVFDCGLHLPHYMKLTDDDREQVHAHSRKELLACGAIPNDSMIEEWRKKVVAIIPTHAHLDHIGALPFLASRYDCPIYATPFTIQVLHRIYEDQKVPMKNDIVTVKLGSVIKISDNLTAEFVNMTHSTPHTAMIILRTKEGVVVYGNDFKFDDSPTLGKPPGYDQLEGLRPKLALIDTLYASTSGFTASESVAEEKLNDVLCGNDFVGKGVMVTTFSSHIARLRSIVKCAKKMKRKVAFVGRSLAKYAYAARDIHLEEFSDVKIVSFSKQVHRFFESIDKEREKWLVVTTGHQGEPFAVLSRLADRKIAYPLSSKDVVVFSCRVIPTEPSIGNRKVLESKLDRLGVKVFKDIHASGHGALGDIEKLVDLLQPELVIPAHSEKDEMDAFTAMVKKKGFVVGKSVIEVMSGDRLTI